MAIALAVSQDHIATVFDSAESLLIIEAGPERKRRSEVVNPGMSMIQVRQRLQEWKVNVLLCGAIANFTQQFIEGAGIIVIPFLKGHIDEVEAGFFANRLYEPSFSLPGCRRGWTRHGSGPCEVAAEGTGRRESSKEKGRCRRGRK